MTEEKPLRHRHRSFVGPVLIIIIGILFLLNNFGVVSWGVWGELWRLWPLLLIAAGLQAVFGGSLVASIITGILTILLIIAAIFFFIVNTDSRVNDWAATHLPIYATPLIKQLPDSETAYGVPIEEYSGITARTVSVHSGIGKVTVNDTSDDIYFSSTSFGNPGDVPTLDKTVANNNLTLNFTAADGSPTFGSFGALRHTIKLGLPSIPTALRVNIGTGAGTIDFNQLILSDLNVSVGTGTSDITLSQTSLPAQAHLEVGTGALQLHLSKDTGLDVHYDVGLGAIKVGDTTLRGTGSYRSENYDLATKKIVLTLQVGTGTIVIDRQ